MKKLFILIGLSIILQVIYYVFFMQTDFIHQKFSYNIVSIISVLFFVGYYLKQTLFTFKYGISYIVYNIFIGFVIMVALLILIMFVSLFGSYSTQAIYFFFHSLHESKFHNPLFGQIWGYNLVNLNFALFAINLFITIIKSEKDDYVRMLVFIHKSLSVVLLVSVVFFMIMNLAAFYYFIYVVISFLIIWFVIPVLFNICYQFKNFHGVLLGWCFTMILLWPLMQKIFSEFEYIYGYIF